MRASLGPIIIVAFSISACGGGSTGDGNNNLNNNNGFDPPLCGDGVVEGAEECDDGPQNTDLDPDACRATCLNAHCGDTVTDTGETCDDGVENSDQIPGACRVDCSQPGCGDGVIDVTLGEGCDDGGQVAGDGCGPSCVDEYCTNGIVDPLEVCDDGNVENGDGCSSDCRSDETCGNGLLDFFAGEVCDCGASDTERPASCAAYNGQPGSPCTSGCAINYCGNGQVDPGEVCDDGNFLQGDGCSPDCLSDETCGNGRPDFFVGETCDCGIDPANLPAGCSAINGAPGSECNATCQTQVCGDGAVTGSEVCDDGNLFAGDGCSPDCLSDETCGNGRPDFAAGETCDCGTDPANLPPGCLATNGQPLSPCGASCQSLFCGNGILDAGELCDDGNNKPGDGCAPDCRSTEVCGNGVPDFFVGEECDCSDGVGPLPPGCAAANGDPTSHCGATCRLQRCGNGLTDPGEACDDGNAVAGDGCSANCRSDESCGNGIRDPGEGCDDGNTTDGDGCSSACARPACGNGSLDAAEVCDDGNNVSGDGCNATCTSTEVCGNRIVDVGEACDDGNAVAGDGCDPACAREICGNGVIDAAEECDDGNATDGDGCDAACRQEACGNGVLNAGEGCDDGNLTAGDGCDATCILEICGNGIVDANEICDDGNTLDGDPCSADCQADCGPGWVYVPPGLFERGCNPGEQNGDCDSDESPRHPVLLTEGYCLQQTEVTVAQYRACVTGGVCATPGTGSFCNWAEPLGTVEDHPINCVGFAAARSYCQSWEGGDLPTEAEWEKGARGLDARKYPWGDAPAPDCNHANFDVNVGGAGDGCAMTIVPPGTWPVGSASPTGDSPFGLQDASGNVAEWVLDRYCATFYATNCLNGCTDPVNLTTACSSTRMDRGGTFGNGVASFLRASQRSTANLGSRRGLRCRRAPTIL